MKQDKKEVKYTDHAMVREERCALCKHYMMYTCKLVEGKIVPGGWCKLFAKK